MPRWTLVLSGLVALMVGTLLTVTSAAADDPPAFVTKFLITQRVQLLSEETPCWNITRQTLPVGARTPAQGYRADPMGVGVVLAGQVQLDYAAGPSMTMSAGEGIFVGNHNWYAVTNVGTTPAEAIIYTMTCQPVPAGVRGVTQLGNSGPLAGTRPGGVYDLVFVEVTGVPGSMIAAHTHPSTESAYLLAGTLALSTSTGVKEYRARDIAIVPAGTPHQGTMVSATPGRLVSSYLTPAGQPIRDYLPDARLPVPGGTPSALPRTGETFSWAGSLTMLLGAVLLVAGIGWRRQRQV